MFHVKHAGSRKRAIRAYPAVEESVWLPDTLLRKERIEHKHSFVTGQQSRISSNGAFSQCRAALPPFHVKHCG